MNLFRTIKCSIKLQFKYLSEYRIGLLNQIIGLFVGYISTFIVYYLMFQKFSDLKGWKFGEVMYVYSFAMVTINLSSILFNHFRYQDKEIIDGSFDKYLIKPLNPFLYFCISKIDVAELLNLGLSVSIYLYFGILNQVFHQPMNLVYIFIFLITSTLMNGSFLVLIGAISFWTKRSEILYSTVIWPFQFLAYLPITIFPTVIQGILTYVLPFAIVSYYPALIVLRKVSNCYMMLMNIIFIAVVFFIISYFVWQLGLKKYEGSGS